MKRFLLVLMLSISSLPSAQAANTFDTNGMNRFVVTDWPTFRKYIDGTYSTLAFYWTQENGTGGTTFYHIVTESQNGMFLEFYLIRDGGANQTDFDNNFKNLNPRALSSNWSPGVDRTNSATVTTTGNTVAITSQGTGVVGVTCSANTNVTFLVEGSIDGANYNTLSMYPVGGGAAVTSITTTGFWTTPSAGMQSIRARVTATGSTPTATIALDASIGSTIVTAVSPTAGNFNATVTGTVTTTPPANASTNVTQFGGTNISTGTGASGAGIPRFTISNDSALAANQSVNTNQIGGNTVASGNGTTSTGTQRVTISSDSTGQVTLATGANVIGSLSANQSVNMAQVGGSSTGLTGSGASGAGTQRVILSTDSPSMGSTGSAVPSVATLVGTKDSSGNNQAIVSGVTEATATTGVVNQFPTAFTTTPFSATSATGTQTSGADNVGPFAALALGITYSGITGSPSGCSIQVQNSVDGVNFFNYGAVIAIAPGASPQLITPATHPSAFGKQMKYVYACSTTYPSAGTFTLTTHYSSGDTVAAASGGGGTVTQGNAGTNAQAWWVQVGDTTNGPVAVKAASTAAAATDKSFVVALSPNSPIPTGANVIGALTANQSVNLNQVGGNAVVTGGTNGSQGVGGLAAAAAAAAGNPVWIGVKDSSGNIQSLETETTATGNLRVSLYNGATEAAVSANGLQVQQATAANLNAAVVGSTATGSAGTNPVQIAARDASGNVQSLETETTATGNLRVSLYNGATEAAISANGLQVQQGTAANLNATVVGNLTHNNAAPAANNVGALVAVANGVLPTYTNTDQVLLSTDLSGNLRANTTSYQTSGTLTYTSSNNAVTTSGTGTFRGAIVQIISTSITGSPVVTFEASPDSGTTWFAINARKVTTAGVSSAWATTYSAVNETAAFYLGNIEGMNLMRARVSTTGSAGTGATTFNFTNQVVDVPTWAGPSGAAGPPYFAQVGVRDSSGNIQSLETETTATGPLRVSLFNGATEAAISANGLQVQQATAANLNATVVQGNAGTNAQAWWVEVGDTANGPTAVKAASTAAAATDKSFVVALSPNSPIPTGANVIGALTANQSVNLNQVGGNAVVTGGTNGSQGIGGLAATGAAAAGNPVYVGVKDSSGNIQSLETETTATGPLRVALFNGATEANITANGVQVQQATAANLNATVTGTVNANQTSAQQAGTLTYTSSNNAVTYSGATSFPGVVIQIISTSITGSPVVTFEASPDSGTTWYAVNARKITTAGVSSTWSTTYSAVNETVAFHIGNLPGFNQVRARVSTTGSAGSGATTINLVNTDMDVHTWAGAAGVAGPPYFVQVGVRDASGNTQSLETESTATGPLRVGVFNGATEVAVKAASTAAAATDPSFVVAFSPNSALPTGGNVIGTVNANLNQINAVTAVTAASGVLKVGIVGNTGAAMDAAGQNASSPANELLMAGQFNTSPTTITSGNVSPLQLDSTGSLKVNLTANSFGTITVSGTVTANEGGAPWTVKGDVAPGSAASTPVQIGVRDSSGNVQSLETESTAIGPLRVALFNGATEAAISANGLQVQQATAANLNAAVVGSTATGSAGTNPVQIGARDASGNVQSLETESTATGPLRVGVFNGTTETAVKAASTAAAAADPSFVVALSPNSALPTGANVIGALTANQSVNVAQIAGTNTVTAAAGVQKVGIVGNANVAVDAATGSAVPANALLVGTKDTSGNTQAIASGLMEPTTTAGLVNVVESSFTTTPFSATSATATATSAADNIGPFAAVVLGVTSSSITGAPVGCQIQVQNSIDGANYINYSLAMPFSPTATPLELSPLTSATPFGKQLRYIYTCTTYPTGGTITVTAHYASTPTFVAPVANAQAWFAQIGDTVNGPVAVKPASTTPTYLDPALVTSESPNSPVVGELFRLRSTLENMYMEVLNPSYMPPPTVISGLTFRQGPPNPQSDNALVVTEVTQCNRVATIDQSAGTKVISGRSGQQGKFLICAVIIVSATQQGIGLVEGTGTTCGTNPTSLIGDTMTPVQVGANAGFSAISGVPWLMTQVAGDDVCLLQSGAGLLGGVITYTWVPAAYGGNTYP